MCLLPPFRSLWRAVLDFVYPPTCLSCESLLSQREESLCTACWISIERLSTLSPLYQETRRKLVESERVVELVSCFVFQTHGALQSLAHALKYNGYRSVGLRLGRELGRTLQECRLDADVIVPVPLHKRKLRERGFNQSTMIARGISETLGLPIAESAMMRLRYTETQTKLKREERQKNVKDAFVVRDEHASLVRGKRCLLVDDVITTGATACECADALLKAGAACVIAASVALAE